MGYVLNKLSVGYPMLQMGATEEEEEEEDLKGARKGGIGGEG
jgi:hypothetical protein